MGRDRKDTKEPASTKRVQGTQVGDTAGARALGS